MQIHGELAKDGGMYIVPINDQTFSKVKKDQYRQYFVCGQDYKKKRKFLRLKVGGKHYLCNTKTLTLFDEQTLRLAAANSDSLWLEKI